jgi:hypothetical protein
MSIFFFYLAVYNANILELRESPLFMGDFFVNFFVTYLIA